MTADIKNRKPPVTKDMLCDGLPITIGDARKLGLKLNDMSAAVTDPEKLIELIALVAERANNPLTPEIVNSISIREASDLALYIVRATNDQDVDRPT